MRKKWLTNDILFIKNNLHLTNEELSIKLNCSKKAIEHKISSLKFTNRRFDNLNENFFDDWSANMSYILGFTMADGCIYNNEYRFGFGVNQKDKCILKFIAQNLCIDENNIKDSIEKRKDKLHLISRLRICSKKLVNKLNSYNIIPNKTGREKLPNIPDIYKADYLRGLFDGDGSIHISNKKTGQLTFQIVSASKEFLNDVKTNLGFNFGYIHNKNNCYGWYIYKQKHIEIIKNFMYYLGHNFSLDRKRIKFK